MIGPVYQNATDFATPQPDWTISGSNFDLINLRIHEENEQRKKDDKIRRDHELNLRLQKARRLGKITPF